MEVIIHPDANTTARQSAMKIASQIGSTQGQFTLGLAGGSTPEATYRELRDMNVDWDRVAAWLSDERWVPPDHERSNGRMAEHLLIEHVKARLVRPRWSELLQPADSASHYEAELRALHSDNQPNLVLLGMGDDGHTASLFPGTTALEEKERWIVANHVPHHREDRITATYPMLWRAELVMVLVVGDNKAEALRATFDGNTPAARLGDGDARVEWHVDEAAASLL